VFYLQGSVTNYCVHRCGTCPVVVSLFLFPYGQLESMTCVLFTGAERVRGVEREGGGGGRQGARDVRVGTVSGVI